MNIATESDNHPLSNLTGKDISTYMSVSLRDVNL